MIKTFNVVRISQFFCLLTCLYLPQGAQAQPSERVSNDEYVTLSLDNASILDLVRWASDVTDKSIVLHPNVEGRVTVVAGAPMSKQEAYQVFLSVLQVHGLAMMDDGSALTVVPGREAKTGPLPVTTEKSFSLDQDMVVHIVAIKNTSAQNIVGILQPLIPERGYLAAYPSTNMLLIADSSRNIKKLLNIVAQIDRSENQLDIEMIPVKYASAHEISAIINTLIPPHDNDGGNTLNIAIDERSNSILMTGDPGARDQIAKLVKRLDMPLDGNGNTQVIQVQYASVEELVPMLESVASSLQREGQDKSISDVEVSIQPQLQLNAIVITAPPSILSVVKGIVAQLDVPRSQVLVEALIVEVNQDLAAELGVEWSSQNVTDGEGVVGGFSLFPPGLAPLGVADDGNFNLGTGLSLGYLRGGGIRALVNALSGESNANILSTPTILALDNEEAEILVGSSVPFITGTEEREGDTPFQTIERQDIGVSLKVRPHVNNDNSVTIEIEQTVESIGQTAAATADIITNKREITTKVLIRDGHTLALGGLMRDEATDIESKVPLLGDIPILGAAFRSSNTVITKSNLMVFIRPTILHTTEAAASLSEERYEQFINLQEDFRKSVDPTKKIWILNDPPKLPELKRGTLPTGSYDELPLGNPINH